MSIRGIINNGCEAMGRTINAPEAQNAGQNLLRRISQLNEPIKSAANPTMFAIALYSCVFIPRAQAAAKRSATEKREVITRDAFAITTLVFALKAIGGALAKAREKATGLILTSETKPLKDMNPLQKFFEYVRPMNGVHVLSTGQLTSKYAVKDKESLKGLVGWLGDGASKALVVDEKKGNVLAKWAKELFKGDEKGIVDKTAKQICDAIDLDKNSDTVKNMVNILKETDNPLIKKAKFVNSAIIKTASLAIVVSILGVGIQLFNQYLTKKLDKKKEEGKITDKEWQEGKDLINRFRMTPEQTKLFQNFVGTSQPSSPFDR